MGSAIIVHSTDILAGQARHPSGRKPKSNPSVSYDPRAHMDVSIILAISSIDDDEDDFHKLPAFIDGFIPGALLSGGQVISFGSSTAKCCEMVSGNELISLLKLVSAGSVLLDRHDIFIDQMKISGKDTLDTLLDLVEVTESEEPSSRSEGKPVQTRIRPGWLVPLSVGYQAINKPVVRKNTRLEDGITPHVYAEAIYSVGEYRSISTIIALHQEDVMDIAFWRHHHNHVSHTFYVSATEQAN